MKGLKTGIVIKSTGSWYQVRDEATQEITQSRIVGKFRLNDLPITNPIAVGDKVGYELEGEGTGIIRQILPRTNYVARQSPRQLHQLHLLAANIDQALLFTTIVEPDLKPAFIDRFLLMTEPFRIPCILVFNKADIYSPEDRTFFEELKQIYTKIGYTVLLVSALTGEGIGELNELLKDKITMIGGQSGVGKSTVVNAIEPNLELRTGDISDYSGKGQHTTTFAEMHPLSFGGQIIDTPGIKTLGFNNLEKEEVAQNFREMQVLSENCRFGASCMHKNEPNCAVKEGLKNGEVAKMRYHNYLQILSEVTEQNYWQRKKNV